MNKVIREALGKLFVPLLVSVGILTVFYVSGDAYQAFGLAAVDSTRRALKYILGVAAFLSLAVLAQRIIRYVIFEGIIAPATGAPVPKLLSQLSGLIIFMIALSACAGIVFNQDLTVLWAASGVAGLVLGMALKELLQDVFAGIALNIDRAVRIGDFIQIHKAGDARISGELLEISWRTTRVKDFMGDVVIFPNSKFSSFTISNFSQPNPISSRTITISLDARIPLARSTRILQAAALEAMMDVDGSSTALPVIDVKGIKADGVDYVLTFKADCRLVETVASRIYQNVLTHLAQTGLRAVPAKGDNATTPLLTPSAEHLAFTIGATRLFSGVPEAGLALLSQRACVRVEPAGRVVFQTGEAGVALYLVLEGLLCTEGLRRTTNRIPLPSILRPGDLFDAPVALLGEAHSCAVRAKTQVLLCEFNYQTLQGLFSDAPGAIDLVCNNLIASYMPNINIKDEERAREILLQMRHLFPSPGLPASGKP